MYLFSGITFLYSKGNKSILNSNLFKSPYFSLIGNLGNSYGFLLTSITPECWPKPYLKNYLINDVCSRLNSPNG